MRSESGYCANLIISSSSCLLSQSPLTQEKQRPSHGFQLITHLLTVPILQKGIQHIHLLQFPLFVQDFGRGYGRLRAVGDYVIGWIGGGGGRGCEAVVNAVLDCLLKGDVGAEDVEGPLGEDAGVVFVD